MVSLKVDLGIDAGDNINAHIPVGAIVPTLIATPIPDGWLACNGLAISRSTYSDLWTALSGGSGSSPYGNGDGSTTFNVPNLSSRYPLGTTTVGSRGATANTAVSASSSSTDAVGLDHSHNTSDIAYNHYHNWGNYHVSGGPNNLAMNTGTGTNMARNTHVHGITVGGGTGLVSSGHGHGTNSVAGSPGANTTEMSRLINGHSHSIAHTPPDGIFGVDSIRVYYLIKA